MNRTIRLLVSFAIVGAFLVTSLPKINAQQTPSITESTSLVASDFDVEFETLATLTKENILALSKATPTDGVTIDDQELVNLQAGQVGDIIPVVLVLNDQEVSVKATIVNSEAVTPETAPIEISPASIVTNSAATLEIINYDYATGMDNQIVYTVRATANFGNDTTSSGKKLTVTLPEGLRFIQIPVAGTYATAGVDTTLLAQLQGTNPLATAITNVTLPLKEAAPMSQTFGSVTYSFTPGTKIAALEFLVRVDNKRYFQPMETPSPMSVDVDMAGANLGHVEEKIYTKGYLMGSNVLINYTAIPASSEVLASTTTEVSKGKARNMILNLYVVPSPLEVGNRYAKSATYYLHYPQGMIFDSLVQTPSGALVVDDPANSRVIVTMPKWVSSAGFQVQYIVPVGASGVYTNPANDYAEVTFYDGTTMTLTEVGTKYSVNVLTSIVNKLSVTYASSSYYDDSVANNAYVYGPFFQVKNDTAGVKNNQVAEFNFGSNWHVRRVLIPFDSSIIGNTVTNIQYKTNKNTSWRTTTAVSPQNANLNAIIAEDVGLASDEWFTDVKANVGSFSVGFIASQINSIKGHISVSSYGQLATGVANEVTTFSMYDANDEVGTKTSVIGKVINSGLQVKSTATSSTATFTDVNDVVVSQVLAGESFTVKATIGLHTYQYGTTTVMKAPELYLRAPVGISLAIDTLVIKNEDGVKLTDWSYTTYTNAQGDTIYKISTSNNTIIGAYFDALKTKTLSIQYNLVTSVKAAGSYDARDLIGFGKSGITAAVWAFTGPATDTYDLNGNTDTSELMLTTATKTINIMANKNVLVETFLSLSGEEPKAPYVAGDDSTVAYFTPGTDADYTAKITNNGDVPADSYGMFVPIPKTGKNFGPLFQDESFKWDMSLISAITLSAELATKFDVLYSTNATAANFNTTASYSATPPTDLNTVTMVKIISKVAIAPGAEAIIKIPLRVNETFTTATAGSKIGTRDIYNPVYDVVSSAFSGILQATRAGSELVIAEIGGTVFVDKNADGLFKTTDGDTVVADHVIELYKLNTLTNLYEPVLDGSNNHITTTSNASGVYLFDYTKGLGYGTYAVRFVEKAGGVYQYTIHNTADRTIDSDAIIANDIPNVGDLYRGWVLGIDATKPVAKTIGVGFLAYNPPVDLHVDITKATTSIKMTNAQHTPTEILAYTITPTFFDSIKDTVAPYTWTSSDPTTVTVINGMITGLKVGTATITFTIKDIYGYTTSDTIAVTVTSNAIPVITAADTTIEAASTFNALSLASATDVEDATLTINVTQNTVVANVPGLYQVTYSVTDSDNNVATKTINVTVADTVAPVVTITNAAINPSTIAISVVDATATTVAWEVVDANNVKTTGTGLTVTVPTADGTYTVNATATDAGGNTGTKTSTFTIDKTNPVVTITNTAFNPSTIAISVDDTTATSVAWEVVDANGIKTTGTGLTVTVPTVDGPYTVNATATDAAGNVGTQTSTFTIDKTNPVVTITNAAYNPSTIAISVVDATATSVAWEVVDANNVKTTGTGLTVTVPTADGTYTVNATATDAAGNIGTKSSTFTIDKTNPVVTITNAAINPSTIAISVDDTTATSVAWEVIDANGLKTTGTGLTVTVPTEDGAYTVNAAAKDAAGNIGTKSSTFTIDKSNPVVTITNDAINPSTIAISVVDTTATTVAWEVVDANGVKTTGTGLTVTVPTLDGTYTVNATATDVAGNVGTQTSTLTIDKTNPVVTITNDAFNPSTIAITVDDTTATTVAWEVVDANNVKTSGTGLTVTVPTNDGAYTVNVTATDEAGNVGTQTSTFTIDKTNPIVTITNDAYNPSEITISVDDSTATTVAWEVVDANGVTTTGTGLTVTVPTEDGEYTVNVTVTDEAGNVTTETATFINDRTNPVVTITNDAVNPQVIDIAVDDPNATVAWEVIDANGVKTTGTGLTVTLPTVDGEYTINVSATDEAGNIGTGTSSFLIDYTGPIIDSLDEVTYERMSSVDEAQFILDDNIVLNEQGTITADISGVDFSLAGTYPVVVTVEDDYGNISTKTVYVIIEDTVLPTIESKPSTSYQIYEIVDEARLLSDLGASMDEAGTLTADLSKVDFNMIGRYEVLLTGTDLSGNKVEKLVYVDVFDFYNRETSEVMNGHGFSVPLKDIDTVDWISMSEVKAWSIIDGVKGEEVQVKMVSPVPTLSGDYLIAFETAKGTRYEVLVTVTNGIDGYVLEGQDVTISYEELKGHISKGTVEQFLLEKTQAYSYYTTYEGEKVELEVHVDLMGIDKVTNETKMKVQLFVYEEATPGIMSAMAMSEMDTPVAKVIAAEKLINITIEYKKENLPDTGLTSILPFGIGAIVIGLATMFKRKED